MSSVVERKKVMGQTPLRWVAIAVTAAIVTLCWVGTASALTLDDIKRMVSAGLDDNTIISIVENSGDRFTVDTKVLKDLEAAGASDRVIAAIKATAPAGATTDTGATTTSGGPAPLPAGVGNLGKLINQGAQMAKQRYAISAEAAKRLIAQKSNEQAQAKQDIAYQTIEKLTRDFAKSDKWKSLAACHNFLLEYAPAPNTDEYYTALWCKGEAFNKLGLHNLAAPILRDIVMFGGERPHFDAAFESLVESSEAAGYFPASLADLDTVYIDDKPHALQDHFNYFVGKFFMDTLDEYERALALLAKVRPDSPYYARTLYASGVMQASEKLKLYRAAVDSFQQAVVTAEKQIGAESNRAIVELSYLALARIAYEAANYDGALYYYNKINRFSPRYPGALFEMAWTYFMKGDHRQALGTFHSVSSPYYDDHYFPDLWVLEANVYLNLCRYDEANQALTVFRDLYLAKLPMLSQFLASQSDPAGYYRAVVDLAEGRSQDPAAAVPPLFLEAVIANVEFYNLYKVVKQIQTEVDVVRGVSADLGPFGEELLSKLERLNENKLFEAGLKTQNILKAIEDELRDWDVTSTEVSIEIEIAEKDLDEYCLQLAAQGKPCQFKQEESTVLFLVADDWQFWPFEGEYWVDEVGSYKSYLGDRCSVVDVDATSEVQE